MMSTTAASTQTTPTGPMQGRMSSSADTCMRCERMCLETITYCLDQGGKHYSDASLIIALQNCAKMCGCTARFLATQSHLYYHTCNACSKVCYECAKMCERMMKKGDKMMMDCMDMCNKCGDECGEMTKMQAKA